MTENTETVHPAESGRAAVGRATAGRAASPGVALAIVLAGQLMAMLDASIVYVAEPAIHATLGVSGAGLQLVAAGYTIAYAVLLVTGARVGDILGYRRVYLAGVAMFTLASLGCGLAPTTGVLIGLRFVQGAGAATMIPQMLSLIQRTYTSPGPRARAMSLYAAVLAGGVVLGQVLGGLLVSANLFGSSWRPVFLVNVPIGLLILACGRLLPAGRFDRVRLLDLPGLAVLTPAVLAFVLPLVLGQPLGWPLWGWFLLAASLALFVLLGVVERRVGSRGGQPILPRSLLGLPGMTAGLGGLLALMTAFGGWMFTLALQLQDGLGESPLRAGLTFLPSGAAFGLVSLNWRRLPARYHGLLVMTGFVVDCLGLLWVGLLLHSGGRGGFWLYVALAASGAGMASAFGPLMTRVLSRVPLALAADASGVVVTVNQLGNVLGVAVLGALYLNRAGQLPTGPVVARELGAFALSSGRAYLTVSVALGVLALVGAALAALHGRAIAKLSSKALRGFPSARGGPDTIAVFAIGSAPRRNPGAWGMSPPGKAGCAPGTVALFAIGRASGGVRGSSPREITAGGRLPGDRLLP
jgi:MFS family permease